jgi:hypothetical protein
MKNSRSHHTELHRTVRVFWVVTSAKGARPKRPEKAQAPIKYAVTLTSHPRPYDLLTGVCLRMRTDALQYKPSCWPILPGGQGTVIMTNSDAGQGPHLEILRGLAARFGWPGYRSIEKTVVQLKQGDMKQFEGVYLLGAVSSSRSAFWTTTIAPVPRWKEVRKK